MGSLYHAYQSYERQVVKGVFCTRRLKPASSLSSSFECFLADLGEVLIRVGQQLKRRCEIRQAISGSAALGKLDR